MHFGVSSTRTKQHQQSYLHTNSTKQSAEKQRKNERNKDEWYEAHQCMLNAANIAKCINVLLSNKKRSKNAAAAASESEESM